MSDYRARTISIERVVRCWTNYNYLKYYYIIDGPRYAVMIVRQTLVILHVSSARFRLAQRHLSAEYHPSSVDQDQRRLGEANPRRVSEPR